MLTSVTDPYRSTPGGGKKKSTEPIYGQSRTPTKTPLFSPSLPHSRLMFLCPPAPPPLPPRIRGVETTSRHFVQAGRPSETGGDNRE